MEIIGVFVCNFCGGDHGATECEELLCPNCFKAVCEHGINEEITSGEAMESIEDVIWDIVPEEDADTLEEEFSGDLPVEFFAHVVATYSIPAHAEYLKNLFPVDHPNDGRIWNKSRKFGACYKFAFLAQQDEADEIRELVGADAEVYLVQGYCRGRSGAYVGHSWVEVADHVVDCGTHRQEFTPYERATYYSLFSVKYPQRYTTEEARGKFLEAEAFSSWGEPPDDLPMQSGQ